MLCITLLPGEYVTIDAPREVPILRGEVLERNGGKRPSCVYSKRRGASREASPS